MKGLLPQTLALFDEIAMAVPTSVELTQFADRTISQPTITVLESGDSHGDQQAQDR